MNNSEVENWSIIENPKENVYKNLMKTLCDYSDKFYFVTRKQLDYDQAVIESFAPYVIDSFETNEWASTITDGPPATIYVFEANEETYHLLVNAAKSLYDWVAPNLPEDLTFMKNDFVWFSSTTHEEFSCFSIRSNYYKKVMLDITGLRLERFE